MKQTGASKTIHDVKTTAYRVTIDVDRAIESGALDEDSGLRQGTSIDYTFYIDADDLMRRMEFTLGQAHAQMDITRFGDPVQIVAPAADEVVEEGELSEAA